MFKRLSERFPAAATRLEAYTGASFDATTMVYTPEASRTEPASSGGITSSSPPPESTAPRVLPTLFGEECGSLQSDGSPPATLKTSLTERFNAESMAAAASSMVGFMQKAKVVATTVAKEGADKARKVLDAADMDALQRRLSYALDRSTGEVNVELLNFSYLSTNLVAMGFPSMNLGTHRSLLKDNPIDLVAMYLNAKHHGHYMIWNMSEEAYDYTYFDNQVLEFNFPGHPAPPLGLLFKICSSIENWQQADAKNLAVVHCLTGKGRTATVMACYLAWIGQFPNAMESLEFVAEKRQTSVEKLTIPSQRRYIQYFNNVMDGIKPRSSPLLLCRVIINTIPVFEERRVLEPATTLLLPDGSETVGVEGESLATSALPAKAETDAMGLVKTMETGCCPYLQIFKDGKLVFTTTWRDMEDGRGIQWVTTGDGSVSFNVNCMLQGDILIRCRHLTETGQRVSMFRGAFHTGYISQGILRLTKAQLDGACSDSRFDNDFFVDFIFADVKAEGHALPADAHNNVPITDSISEGVLLNEEDRQAYDDMLHRDEVFWQEIEDRKERLQKQREDQFKMKAEAMAVATAKAKGEAEANTVRKAQTVPMQTPFSISGTDEDTADVEKADRKSSWSEEKDKELMSELESFSKGALAKATEDVEEEKIRDVSVTVSEQVFPDPSNENDGLNNLEKELASLSDSKMDPQLELLDAELKGLEGLSPKTGDDTNDVLDFGADDFEELEEYLSGLSTK